MIYQSFSKRQNIAMTWWNRPQFKDRDGIIADGSVRSGKTLSMSVGFILWSMSTFDKQTFAMCGKTIEALRRNVIRLIPEWLEGVFDIVEKRGDNKMIVTAPNGVQNTYYLFGGKDESSSKVIQGITLAGVLFDEVAIQPKSFVDQAIARCSVAGSKFWFNCNPESPYHWFYTDWVERAEERHVVHLHFTMADNLSLSEEIKTRYENLYAGVFYQRYILGLWVMAEGVIYDMFTEGENTTEEELEIEGQWYVASDFGIQNPNVWLKIGKEKGTDRWYVADESVWSGRDQQRQKTVQELADDLDKMMDGDKPKCVIIDPSAAAMKVELRKRGYRVRDADNDVLAGIADVQSMLSNGRLIVNKRCKAMIKEFHSYAWDSKAADRGEDKPLKVSDHCMDAVRYLVHTLKLVKKGDKAPSSTYHSYLE